MLKNYMKVALRNLLRRRTYSLLNVTGLGVGMACAILVMLWVRYELSYDRFHTNADRLYRVVFYKWAKRISRILAAGSAGKVSERQFSGIEQTTNYSEMEFKLSHETNGFFCKGSIVDSTFFQMFSFKLEEGDVRTVLTNSNSVVISRSLALKIFGQETPVGKTLKLNDHPGTNCNRSIFRCAENIAYPIRFSSAFFQRSWLYEMWTGKASRRMSYSTRMLPSMR